MINNLTSYFKPDGRPTEEGIRYFRDRNKPGGLQAFMRPAAGVFIANSANAIGLNAQAQVGNRTIIAPFVSSRALTIDQLGISVSAFVAGANFKCVVYSADADGRPAAILRETANISGDTPNATRFASITPLSLAAGATYWLGLRSSSTATVRTLGVGATAVLSYTNAATPVAQGALVATQTFADPAADWTYASGQHSNALVPLILMRAA
jgi:hypothetical protein